jgi:hypothetical protein
LRLLTTLALTLVMVATSQKGINLEWKAQPLDINRFHELAATVQQLVERMLDFEKRFPTPKEESVDAEVQEEDEPVPAVQEEDEPVGIKKPPALPPALFSSSSSSEPSSSSSSDSDCASTRKGSESGSDNDIAPTRKRKVNKNPTNQPSESSDDQQEGNTHSGKEHPVESTKHSGKAEKRAGNAVPVGSPIHSGKTENQLQGDLDEPIPRKRKGKKNAGKQHPEATDHDKDMKPTSSHDSDEQPAVAHAERVSQSTAASSSSKDDATKNRKHLRRAENDSPKPAAPYSEGERDDEPNRKKKKAKHTK